MWGGKTVWAGVQGFRSFELFNGLRGFELEFVDGAWANTPNWPDSGFIFLLRLGCWALARGGLEIKVPSRLESDSKLF